MSATNFETDDILIFFEFQNYVKFLECAKATLLTFYGEDPQKSPDLCRIVSRAHTDRIAVSGSSLCGTRGRQVDKFLESMYICKKYTYIQMCTYIY